MKGHKKKWNRKDGPEWSGRKWCEEKIGFSCTFFHKNIFSSYLRSSFFILDIMQDIKNHLIFYTLSPILSVIWSHTYLIHIPLHFAGKMHTNWRNHKMPIHSYTHSEFQICSTNNYHPNGNRVMSVFSIFSILFQQFLYFKIFYDII